MTPEIPKTTDELLALICDFGYVVTIYGERFSEAHPRVRNGTNRPTFELPLELPLKMIEEIKAGRSEVKYGGQAVGDELIQWIEATPVGRLRSV